jgi:hypothetical protein
MNKNFYLIVFLLPLLGCTVQLNAQDKTLSGTWALDVDKSIGRMSLQSKSKFDSLTVDRKARAKSSMDGRVFNFHADGKFTVSWKAGEQLRESAGTWVIGPEADALTITIDSKPQIFDYSFADGFLLLKERESTGMFTTLCFKRQ